MNNTGWIKMHRSLLDWEWYGDINTKILFLHLLLKANHKDKKWQGKTIKRGSFITGVHALSSELGISIQMVRTAISKLKSTNEITIESTNKNSIITIVNYDNYQDIESEQHPNQQTSNKPVTNEQQSINNNQECKEDKECKEEDNSYTPDGGGSADEVVVEETEVEADDGKRKKVAPKKEKSEPPAIEEFVEYGLANITGVTSYRSDLWESVLRRKYTAWLESGWRTGGKKPKPIQVWKTTLLNSLPYLERDVSVMIRSQPTVSKLEHNLAVGARVWGIN